MTKQTIFGSGLILVAFFMFASGVGDTIKDLQDWHGLGTPAIVGALFRQLGQIGIAALGGTLLPGVGTASQNREELTVDITKVGKP